MTNDSTAKLDSLLTDAMNAEAQAKKFYLDAAEKAQSAAGKKLFQELAEFEQNHYDRVKKILELRSGGLKITEPVPSKQSPTVSEVEGQFEPNKDEIIKILTIGIEAEKKAQAKYLEIANLAEDNETKNIFNNMAEEERKHKSILDDQFYSMSNKGKIIWGD